MHVHVLKYNYAHINTHMYIYNNIGRCIWIMMKQHRIGNCSCVYANTNAQYKCKQANAHHRRHHDISIIAKEAYKCEIEHSSTVVCVHM